MALPVQSATLHIIHHEPGFLTFQSAWKAVHGSSEPISPSLLKAYVSDFISFRLELEESTAFLVGLRYYTSPMFELSWRKELFDVTLGGYHSVI